MKTSPPTLKRQARLSRKRDFRRAYAAGLAYRGRFLSVFSCRNTLPHDRIAIIVSRSLEPLSSRRNYLRRVIREIYRKNAHSLKENRDTIFKVHHQPHELCYRKIQQDFLNFCQKQNQHVKTRTNSNN